MCQKYDGIPFIVSQALGSFLDCFETPGILHMALTHGVLIY
jgi:hypothetical protein